MTPDVLNKLLIEFLQLPKETEWLELKQARRNYHFDDLGKYFSALSNEANLKNKECGWLIFGIDDDRNIVGSQFRKNRADLESLKSEIANHTTGNVSFVEIFELNLAEGRVIMFQIPPAPKGIPVAWKGHYYGRNDEALSALNIHEIEQIRNQAKHDDWSAQVCESATMQDLDKEAIRKAKSEFRAKHGHLSDEMKNWDDITFLNKAKITIQGRITRTAIILLGKEESEHYLLPSLAKMTWVLKDDHNMEKDYAHFGTPFILNVEKLFNKARNLNYRYLPNGTLFPIQGVG